MGGDFWAYFLAAIGCIVVFTASALLVALILHFWGDRWGPKHDPWVRWTFAWCWSIGVKIVTTPLLVFLSMAVVWGLTMIFFTPLTNVIMRDN